MPSMGVGLSKGAGMFGSFFRFWWKHKFMLLFFFFIVLQVILVGFQTHDPNTALKKLGEMTLNPLKNLQVISQNILTNKGFYDPSQGVIKGIGNCFYILWSAFVSLYTVWVWIQLFRWLFIQFNNSERFSATLIGTIIYTLVQMVYLGATGKNIWTPFIAISSFVKAIPYLVKPISDLGKKLYKFN